MGVTRGWALAVVAGMLAGVTVLGIVFATGLRTPKARPAPAAAGGAVDEYVPGVKRWTGVFEGEGVKVLKGKDAQQLESVQPDVVFDVQVMRVAFVPAEFRVKKGQVVQFRLHGKDNGLADMPELQGATGLKDFSGHGFHILGPYDVWVTGIRKDVTRTVTFRATESGEFDVECVVFCSPYHYRMRGKLIVEE